MAPSWSCPFRGREKNSSAFTLVEILAAMTVLLILLGIIVAVMNSVSTTVKRTSSKIEAFAAARAGFNLLGQKVSQATLNTYWDYDDPLNPTVYRRQSDMQFVIRSNQQNPGYGQEIYFQSPQSYSTDPALGSTEGLMNACGFYVQYCGDSSFRPSTEGAKPGRYRYRLMQAIQPSEALQVFNQNPLAAWSSGWLTSVGNVGDGTVNQNAAPLADNVIALILWPRLSQAADSAGTELTADYGYDSKNNWSQNPQPLTANQLPPTLQVTLITISEVSAARLDTGSSSPPSVIESALQGRFVDVTRYDQDLQDVDDALSQSRIEFNIFSTTIALRESKWSDQ